MGIYGEYMEYLPMSIYFSDTFGGVGLVEVLREPLHGDWHKAATRREQVTRHPRVRESTNPWKCGSTSLKCANVQAAQ